MHGAITLEGNINDPSNELIGRIRESFTAHIYENYRLKIDRSMKPNCSADSIRISGYHQSFDGVVSCRIPVLCNHDFYVSYYIYTGNKIEHLGGVIEPTSKESNADCYR